MKTFNLVFLSLAFAILTTWSICYVADKFLSEQALKMFIIIPALLVGMNARKIMEKVLGYTLKDSVKENSDENVD